MSYPPEKLCSNCDYCTPAWKLWPANVESAYMYARCHHPSARKPNTQAMVHPALEQREPEYDYCEIQRLREMQTGCGPDARNFKWMDQREPEDVRREADAP